MLRFGNIKTLAFTVTGYSRLQYMKQGYQNKTVWSAPVSQNKTVRITLVSQNKTKNWPERSGHSY